MEKDNDVVSERVEKSIYNLSSQHNSKVVRTDALLVESEIRQSLTPPGSSLDLIYSAVTQSSLTPPIIHSFHLAVQ